MDVSDTHRLPILLRLRKRLQRNSLRLALLNKIHNCPLVISQLQLCRLLNDGIGAGRAATSARGSRAHAPLLPAVDLVLEEPLEVPVVIGVLTIVIGVDVTLLLLLVGESACSFARRVEQLAALVGLHGAETTVGYVTSFGAHV